MSRSSPVPPSLINQKITNTFFIVFSALVTVYAQSDLIFDFRAASISCDYLIITPDGLLPAALKLARHRNAYTSDGVEHAKAVTLTTLYNQFPVSDTLPISFSIWYALKFSREQWTQKPEYVVLLGDDSVAVNGFDTLSAPPKSAGLMPTFYLRADKPRTIRDTFVDYLDFFYLTVSDSIPPVRRSGNTYRGTFDSAINPFALGRIPARTNGECGNYIDKVIRFDSLNEKGAWFNNVHLSADDSRQGAFRDPLFPTFLQSSERVVETALNGFFIHKTYLSSFIKTPPGFHDNAKNDFFNAINTGVRWSAYFGHGKDDHLSDEFFLESKDTSLFSNDAAPFIMFSFSCGNGYFLRNAVLPMCESFLFKKTGGCIAYFAATAATYAFENEHLAKALFNQSNSPQRLSLGKAAAMALASAGNNSMRYYTVLGDPAVLFSKSGVRISTSADRDENDNISLSSRVREPGLSPFKFRYEITRRDSLACLDDSSVSYIRDSLLAAGEGTCNGAITTTLPTYPGAAGVIYTLYVWNDAYEGRIDTSFNLTCHAVYAPTQQTSTPLIRFKRGILSLSLPSATITNSLTLSIVDMRGIQVGRSTLANVKTKAIFDLNNMGIANGNYIFRIKAGNQTFTGRICHIW